MHPFLTSSNLELLGSMVCLVGSTALWPRIFILLGIRGTQVLFGSVENQALKLHKKGDTAGAVSLLRQAIQSTGPTASHCGTLALLLAAQGQWQESLTLSEQAEEMSGGKAVYLTYQAAALWHLDRQQGALECLRVAERRDPMNVALLCEHGSLLVQLARFDEAVILLRRAEKLLADQGKVSRSVDPVNLDCVVRLRASLLKHDVQLT